MGTGGRRNGHRSMLKGEKVVLRALEMEDLPSCHRWINDWEVKHNIAALYPLSMTEEERWYQGVMERKDGRLFAIAAEDDKLIGTIDLFHMSLEDRAGELGMMIGEKDYWGKGYGSDAVRTLLRFAFDTVNLHRIELRAFEFNDRAIRCYERCGFKREGVLRQRVFRDGRYWDVILMGILREEFAA